MVTFPILETFANYAAPAINFGRGILGFQDPVGTSSMQQDLIERATTKGGESGSLGYEDFGLETATPGGRFTGGLFDLISNPAAFGNVGSTGRVTYKQNPNVTGGYTFGDTKYDFTLDPSDTGIGANILNFINKGGIRSYFNDDEKGTIISNLKRKIMMDRRATEQGIAQAAMQKQIQEAQAAAIIAAQSGGGGGAGGANVPGTPIVPVPTPSYSQSYNPGAGGVVTHTPVSTPASTVPGPQAYHQPSSGGGGAAGAGGGSQQAQSGGSSPSGGWGGGWGWSRGGIVDLYRNLHRYGGFI